MRARGLFSALPIAVAVTIAVAAVAWAQADEQLLGGKFRAGDEVTIGADEVVEGDLYAAAGRVIVDGTVEGDLVAAAGEVVVRGTVTGDAIVAGGAVRIPGRVTETLRAAAGEVTLGGDVARDVVAAAGSLKIDRGAEVAGDVVFSAGELSLDGAVGGNLLGRSGRYVSHGDVAGTERVEIVRDEPTAADRVVDVLRRYASLLVVAALLLWLARRPFDIGAERIRRKPLLSLGAGLGGVLGGVAAIIAVVLVVALLGLLLGLLDLGALVAVVVLGGVLAVATLVFTLFVALGFLVHVVVGLWLGRFVVGDTPGWSRAFGAAAVGLAAIVLASHIPFLGPLVRALVVLVGLGALVLTGWERWRGGAGRGGQAAQTQVS